MSDNHNAKFAFYYLLSLVALIFMSISVGLIAFGIIDKTIADALAFANYSNPDGSFKFAISALFISVPIFYLISSLIRRGLKKGELTLESGIRRWLTYLILLVSSLIILGVFIGIINSFLSGELTSRFILKALSMLVIASSVFSFYFYDIKKTEVVAKDKIVKWFFIGSLTLVIAAFIAAWFFVELPQEARSRRLDQTIINNMYSLESSVNSYYGAYETLPTSLDEIKTKGDLYLDPRSMTDPETGAAITYNPLTADTFELCATFRTSTLNDINRDMYSYPSGPKDHEAGYQCLKSTVWNNVNVKEAMPRPIN